MIFRSVFIIFACSILGSDTLFGQLKGKISGDLMTNVNFYSRDSAINAVGTPLYNNFLSGGESWFGVRYSQPGFNVNLRFDGFYNSNLFYPKGFTNAQGIGMWSIQKEFAQGFDVKVGYIYTQIGSGLLFRSYEDRGLLIDNALVGFQGQYRVNEHIKLQGLMGRQKLLFEQQLPVIKLFNAEFDYDFGESGHITTGGAILNRTLDYGTMNALVSEIEGLPPAERFVPTYNMYAGTIYNTLNFGQFSWYLEGGLKSKEAIRDFSGNLHNSNGNVIFSTLGYTGTGWGLNATFKRTDNFVMQTSPMVSLPNAGMINWQPVVAQIRPQRLLSRYTPPALSNSEQAMAIDAFYSPSENLDLNACFTKINLLNGDKLYQELFLEMISRPFDTWTFTLGSQLLGYNQAYYQGHNPVDFPYFRSMSGWIEVAKRLSDTKSIRAEFQSMLAYQDFGSWVYGLVEYNVAPHWSLAISDMYNYSPNLSHSYITGANHFPNIFVGFTVKATRFTMQWVKQVEGINCTGGVCRYEPAFSGFKFGLTSTF